MITILFTIGFSATSNDKAIFPFDTCASGLTSENFPVANNLLWASSTLLLEKYSPAFNCVISKSSAVVTLLFPVNFTDEITIDLSVSSLRVFTATPFSFNKSTTFSFSTTSTTILTPPS